MKRKLPPDRAIWDETKRIQDIFGCTCQLRVLSVEVDGSLQTVRVRHQAGCRYDPVAVFRPHEPVDQEALDKGAKMAKKARQRAQRKYGT